jgi:ankyrin repeat protein
MNSLKRAVVAVAAACLSAAAGAQAGGYDGAQFVNAIESGKTDEAVKLIQGNPGLVNARNSNGQTALVAAISKRDDGWTGYLLTHDADVNLPSGSGETPLIAAARIGFDDAIVAVQGRHTGIVRMLVNAGANPDKTDSVQGYSAREYAKRDTRSPELLRIIEAKKHEAR